MTAPLFTMIDAERRRVTRQRAIACGTLTIGQEAFTRIAEGDGLTLAKVAGTMGAKKVPDLLPLCQHLPLDQVAVHCALREPHAVDVYCQVVAQARTGVAMEAIMGVQAALAALWDLTRHTEPSPTIDGLRLLIQEGGEQGLWVNPAGIPDWLAEQLTAAQMEGMKSAILVMSDRASAGQYEDKSGPLLQNLLEGAGATVVARQLVADNAEEIDASIRALCDVHAPDILLTSGGTGPGPRDVTPEVVRQLCDRMLDGLGELLRRESAAFTDTAWLSRMTGGVYGRTLIVTLPGSPKAIKECWEIIAPFIGRSLKMIALQGHRKEG